MSRLYAWNATVDIYPEEFVISRDGNKYGRASSTPYSEVRAMIQPVSSTETPDGMTTEVYRFRPVRSFPHVLGARSQIVWNGARWSIHGPAIHHGGSPRTARIEYFIKRG